MDLVWHMRLGLGLGLGLVQIGVTVTVKVYIDLFGDIELGLGVVLGL